MMKLGIDIDGTIKHTQKAAIKVYNKEFDLNIKEDEVETYYLDEPYGLTPEEGAKIWRKLETKIYKIGVPLENAPEALQQLVDEGHEVFFITARPDFKQVEQVTKEWLMKHGFPYNGENLFMNSHDKGMIAQKLGIDLFFEDDPEHIDNLLAAKIATVIVDMKYNRNYPDDILRISDWYQGLDFVHQFKTMIHTQK